MRKRKTISSEKLVNCLAKLNTSLFEVRLYNKSCHRLKYVTKIEILHIFDVSNDMRLYEKFTINYSTKKDVYNSS